MNGPSSEVFDVELPGCRPEPIGSYLKALAVLRLVAEQKDAAAKGFWSGETFVLRSRLSREKLVSFFAEEWMPTPLAAPWNGGSGFYPKDNKEAADAMLASDDPRLQTYASIIVTIREMIIARAWTERPADDDKLELLNFLRSTMPDPFLAWLDAAVVLGDDKAMFPPLLGTGGNDGRFDFSTNFQQRVVEVLNNKVSPAPALFGIANKSQFKGTLGQFLPSVGERTDPWDFVFLIEGALFITASASRRYESVARGGLAYPFHARAAGGVGTSAEGDEDESRNELWLPLWKIPASEKEIRRLFAEGRAKVGQGDEGRPATTALDFSRAITCLGVDRGISEFVRFGFYVRNGLAYYATPLGRHAVATVANTRLLDEVGNWFDRFRSKTKGNSVPARLVTARRRLETAMFEAASTGALSSVLIELGATEAALSESVGYAVKSDIWPIPARLSGGWIEPDGSPEQRLGAALSRLPIMRERMAPIEKGKFVATKTCTTVFSSQPIDSNLRNLLLRLDVENSQRSKVDTGTRPKAPRLAFNTCSLSDIAEFIDGRTDDHLIEKWLRAFVLIGDEEFRAHWVPPPIDIVLPPTSFALLSIVLSEIVYSHDAPIPRTPGVVAAACAGRIDAASRKAIRRLRAVGLTMPFDSMDEHASRGKRIAAALAFPLTTIQREALEQQILPSKAI